MFFLRSTYTGDEDRRDAFHFIFDTSDKSIRNSDGSVTVATGDQPILLTQANADFRIYESPEVGGPNDKIGGFAAAFDASGELHFVFTNNEDSVSTVKEMVRDTDGVWGSPVDIFETSNVSNSNALVIRADGTIDMYSEDVSGSVLASRGGDIYKRSRSTEGVWGDPTLIQDADVKRLGFVAQVLNGHSTARVFWTEFETLENVENGTLKLFAYGDNGPLRKRL